MATVKAHYAEKAAVLDGQSITRMVRTPTNMQFYNRAGVMVADLLVNYPNTVGALRRMGSFLVGYRDVYIPNWIQPGVSNAMIADPATMPTGNVNGSAWSPDGNYLVVVHTTTPLMTVYKRDGDVLTKLPNPSQLPSYNGGTDFAPYGIAWSPDGQYFTVRIGPQGARQEDTFMYQLASGGTTLNFMGNGGSTSAPAVGGTFTQSMAYSPDGAYYATGNSGTTLKLQLFDHFNGSLTGAALLSPQPDNTPLVVTWSPDGKYLLVGLVAGTRLHIYKRSGTTFTKLATPAVLPTTTVNAISWAPDSQYVVVSNQADPVIFYKVVNDTLVKLTDPSVPNFNARSCAWSPDGNYVAFGIGVSPYMVVYRRTGETFRQVASPASFAAGATFGGGLSWSPNGRYLTMVANSAAGCIKTYKSAMGAISGVAGRADPAAIYPG